MGKRGPAPMPTKLRLLNGNASKRPINTAEPQPPQGEPKMPTDLDKWGRKVWREVMRNLRAMGLATEADAEALASMCRVASIERQAWAKVQDKGLTFKTINGYIQQRPEVGTFLKAAHIKKTYLGEFGLTPSGRSKITLPGQEEHDELADFLSKGRQSG